MTHGEGNHGHPDAVAYLDGLGEEDAAMVCPHEGGHTRYWIEGGEVCSRDVAGDGPPEMLPGRSRRSSGRRRPARTRATG